MTTFVIRFVDGLPESFKGRVRCVGSGEEAIFSSVSELVAFIKGTPATGFSPFHHEPLTDPVPDVTHPTHSGKEVDREADY